MKSIMVTYPGFQGLPKGIKQLLLTSESYFFDEAHYTSAAPARPDYWEPPQARARGAAHSAPAASRNPGPKKLSDGIMNGAYFYQALLNGMTSSSAKSWPPETFFTTTGTNHN